MKDSKQTLSSDDLNKQLSAELKRLSVLCLRTSQGLNAASKYENEDEIKVYNQIKLQVVGPLFIPLGVCLMDILTLQSKINRIKGH